MYYKNENIYAIIFFTLYDMLNFNMQWLIVEHRSSFQTLITIFPLLPPTMPSSSTRATLSSPAVETPALEMQPSHVKRMESGTSGLYSA